MLTKQRGACQPIRPVKAKVMFGESKGAEFLLYGPSDMRQCGFSQGAISCVVHKKANMHRNCVFTLATQEEIKTLPNGPSNEVLINIYLSLSNPKFEIVGTCRLTGKQVKGSTSFDFDELGFNPAGIRNALAGVTQSHARHTWTRSPIL